MVKIAEETRFQLQRGRMLKAAAACFNEKGYSGTSLKDVANHLGLTDAALYYYVRNKEEEKTRWIARAQKAIADSSRPSYIFATTWKSWLAIAAPSQS
jgi:AcrR family transcriptional regulator